jgi:hypothetical protein
MRALRYTQVSQSTTRHAPGGLNHGRDARDLFSRLTKRCTRSLLCCFDRLPTGKCDNRRAQPRKVRPRLRGVGTPRAVTTTLASATITTIEVSNDRACRLQRCVNQQWCV